MKPIGIVSLVAAAAGIVLILGVTSCQMFADMQAMKQVRYEEGTQQGAEQCKTCHPGEYQAWKAQSRHATATEAASFHRMKKAFNESWMLSGMMGEAMCYACHGSKQANEGVSCETCHGNAPPGQDLALVHRQKYTPGLARLRQPEFCLQCHSVKNPLSGEFLLDLASEWQQSPAGRAGQSCQTCHMRKGPQLASHGFASAWRGATPDAENVVLQVLAVNSAELQVLVQNRVQGHSLPAGGPTRVLALEVQFLDAQGKVITQETQTFQKVFSLMPLVGIMPYRLQSNSQLRAAEKRTLRFALPEAVRQQGAQATLDLVYYEVADEFQGDLRQAHWRGTPFGSQRVLLRQPAVGKPPL